MAASFAVAVLMAGVDLPAAAPPQHAGAVKTSTKARLAAIRRAQVWAPTRVAEMDLKTGPVSPNSFAPNELVTCNYLDKPMGGATPKFTCVSGKDDELKIKCGVDNGEVYAEVATTRCAMGAGVRRRPCLPVRVTCQGCPADPPTSAKRRTRCCSIPPRSSER